MTEQRVPKERTKHTLASPSREIPGGSEHISAEFIRAFCGVLLDSAVLGPCVLRIEEEKSWLWKLFVFLLTNEDSFQMSNNLVSYVYSMYVSCVYVCILVFM